MISKLLCFLGWHRLFVIKRFSSVHRKVGCRRCDKKWGMHDTAKAFIPWDGELEELERDL